jgi:hypothetical protein
MSGIADMLAPGERVVHRGSVLHTSWPALLWVAAIILLLSVLLIALLTDGTGPGLLAAGSVMALLDLVLIAALVLGVGPWIGLGETCLATDRRIRFKRGLFRPTVDEMALADVEDAAFAGSMLKITGAGRTLELQAHRNGLGAKILARILPQWFPDPGRPTARLGNVLEPGETVIFRWPSPWFNRVLWALSFGVVGFLLWSGYGSYLRDDWSGVLTMSFFVFLMLSVLPDIRADWQSVATDRRLLQRIDWDATRYQDIPLAEIEADWRSRFGEKLAASWRGQDLDIPARNHAAARVVEAIRAAKGAA